MDSIASVVACREGDREARRVSPAGSLSNEMGIVGKMIILSPSIRSPQSQTDRTAVGEEELEAASYQTRICSGSANLACGCWLQLFSCHFDFWQLQRSFVWECMYASELFRVCIHARDMASDRRDG